jgi:hypothetical protein
MADSQSTTKANGHMDHRRLGDHVRDAIERSLQRRSTAVDTPEREVENRLKRGGARLWAELKKRPYLGIAAAGVGGVAIAAAIGVGELAIGIAVAYGMFNVLVRGESAEEAAREVAREVEKIEKLE